MRTNVVSELRKVASPSRPSVAIALVHPHDPARSVATPILAWHAAFMGLTFQRARRPEHKALQRHRILAAARDFLDQAQHSSELSLADVANLAGMARSNVYRYFDSREAILLAILASELSDWVDDVVDRLDVTAAPRDTRLECLAAALDDATAPRPLLCHLVSVLPGLLDTAGASDPGSPLMLDLHVQRTRLTAAMYRTVPELDEAQHYALLRHMASFVIGAWPLSASAGEGTTLAARRKPSFQRELRRAALLVARGILDTHP